MAGIAPQPREAIEEEDGEAATPEEQELYEEFHLAGMAMMFDQGKVRPGILKLLDDDPSDLMAVLGNVEELKEFSPIVAVAATGAMLALQIVEMGGDALGGENVDRDAVIFHGGRAIIEDLLEIAIEQGAQIDEDGANKAMLMAADLYREAAASKGLVDEEALKAAFDEVVTADKEGRLGEVLPEIEKINQAAAMDGEEA